MGLSVDACAKSIQKLDQEVTQFNQTLRHSKFKSHELDQLDEKVQVTITQLKETLNQLDQAKQNSCFAPSSRNIKIFTGLTVAGFLITSAGIACTLASSTWTFKWTGFALAELTTAITGLTGWYSTKISIEVDQQSQLVQLGEEGIKNAKLFRKFIKSYKKLKKEDLKKIKASLEKKNQEKTQSGEHVLNDLPSSKTQTLTPFIISQDKDETILQIPSTIFNSQVTQIEKLKEVEIQKELHEPKIKHKKKIKDSTLSHSMKLTDRKITRCLSHYNALPEKYKKQELYWKLVSDFIQELPEQDLIKKDFLALAVNSSQQAVNLNVDHAIETEQLAFNILSSAQGLTEVAIEETIELRKKYEKLTHQVSERFKLASPIPYLDSFHKFPVSSDGVLIWDVNQNKPASLV